MRRIRLSHVLNRNANASKRPKVAYMMPVGLAANPQPQTHLRAADVMKILWRKSLLRRPKPL